MVISESSKNTKKCSCVVYHFTQIKDNQSLCNFPLFFGVCLASWAWPLSVLCTCATTMWMVVPQLSCSMVSTFHETEPTPTRNLNMSPKKGPLQKESSLPISNHYFFRTHIGFPGKYHHNLPYFSLKLPNGSCAFPRTDGRQPNQRLTPALPRIQLCEANREAPNEISQGLDLWNAWHVPNGTVVLWMPWQMSRHQPTKI